MIRAFFKWLGIIFLIISINCSLTFAKKKKGLPQFFNIMTLEIKSTIDPRVTRYINLAMEQSKKDDADLIIIEMNTFGGMLDDADKIRTKILRSEVPVFVLINNNAASAGALISISCDSIYMTDGASIGAASVVNEKGELAPEKYQSYMRSLMRSTAETNGRNPNLAEAMVDPSGSTDSLIKKNKVLTFTTKEAIANKFCEAQINSLEELYDYLNLDAENVKHFELTPAQQISNWFLNPIISGVLILIIIGGIYFELQTPGVGFPLIAAIIAALLYFVPYYMEGLAQHWEILLFIAGLALLLIEIFAIPGFGITGIAGIMLIFTSLFLAMLDNVVFDFSFVKSDEITKALGVIFITIIGSIGIILLGGKRILKSSAFSGLVLKNTLGNYQTTSDISEVHDLFTGKSGIAKTDLRPSGKVEIEGSVYDATAQIGYIDKEEKVEVINTYNKSLVVKKKL